MNQFLNQLSKGTLAILVIGAGILFIIVNDPPRTICDIQVERFRESQQRFLYSEKRGVVEMRPEFERLINHCKATNSPGGCLEFFLQLRTLGADLNKVSSECRRAVGRIGQLKSRILESMELMTRLAWGDRPPLNYNVKFGWLDVADMSLFCSLRGHLELFYGQSEWDSFRETMFKELPGINELERNVAWELMILSENCARFP